MTTEVVDVRTAGLTGFAQTSAGRSFFLMLGIAAVIGVMASVWMWSKQPDYRVLFSNFSDRDGGSIVASLQQLNIPYKFAEGGSAILVPAEHVYDARLKLAAEGLPKGGNVGFELMENQKLGISQFLEQVNFQRALEGELARSIQSVAAVQNARVHLALPKASVFVRDQQKPTASVLLNLHPGRTLDRQQVSAVVHLVAASVPELPIKNVTVVDQHGNLLSDMGDGPSPQMLDPAKLQYVQNLQQSIAKRVESIILPIVGAGNVRAEATAEIDFSVTEQASETYRPNQGDNPAAVRSQQSSESQQTGSANAEGGVPGALTNQPPEPNAAPLVAPQGAAADPAAAAQPSSTQRDTTVNYELDKSIQYVQQPMGSIKRLSVAVVVNHKKEIGADGAVTYRPLTEAEQTQLTGLIRDAMGFNQDRGDSLSIVNTPFAGVEQEVIPEVPLWQQPQVIHWGMEAGKYLMAALVLAYLFFAYLRPMLRRVMVEVAPPPALPAAATVSEAVDNDIQEVELVSMQPRVDNLAAVKQIARDDPKMVANIVKSWVDRNE
jgi:flagellar M-ring protein FliF